MPLDYIEDKDIAGSAASAILGGAKDAMISTGADLLSTVWNSTVGNLGADDLSTSDILQVADKDALSFYNQHREGVEAASFLAGIVAPQAATLKLLNWAKNGVSVLGKSNSIATAVTDTFAGTKAQALQSELRVLMEGAKYDTTVYNNTMRKLYAAKIGENAIDAAIFEGVTVGVLNAHPYMEDYMESPFTNFALWATVGAGLGAGLGVIQARAAVRDTLGEIRTTAQAELAQAIPYVNQAMPNGAQIQVYDIGIRNIEALIKTGSNTLIRDLAAESLINIRAAREERLLEAAPWLKPIDKNKPSEFAELRPAIEKMLSQPEMMGVDKIKIPNMKFIPKAKGERLDLEVEMLEKPTKEAMAYVRSLIDNIAANGAIVNNPNLNENVKAIAKNNVARDIALLKEAEETGTKLKTVFYRPATGDLFDRNAAAASALAVDLKGYKPDAKSINLHVPRGDWAIENAARGKASALTDADYLDALLAWNKADLKKVEHYGIAPSDLPSLNGAASWLLTKTEGVLETIQFNLRSDLPSFNQTTKFIESGAAGVKPTHLSDVKNIIVNDAVSFRALGISRELESALSSWIHGQGSIGGKPMGIKAAESALSRGMQLHLTGLQALNKDEEVWKQLAAEMWNKGAKLREALKPHADANGYIRLYRGATKELKHHRGIESYSPVQNVSDKFGTAHLYEIHIDSVVGTVGKGRLEEYEILVTGSHHDVATNIGTHAPKEVYIPNAGSKNTISGVELIQHYTAETERQIKQLISDKSFSPEEIAARLNTTKEAVLLVGMGKELKEIPNWRRYDDVSKIESEYLNKKNRIVALQGDPVANQFTPVKLAASLDKRFLDAGHQQFVEMVTAKHKASLASDMLELWSPLNSLQDAKETHWTLDQLKANLGEVNNIMIKSPFGQSLDMALRNIKDGPLVTYIGKRVADIQDKAIERILKPVGAGFKGLGNSQAALVEFNVLRNKINSLPGWKDLRVEEETGYRYIVQREIREGKVIEVPLKNTDGSVYYIKTPEAINAIENTRNASMEILKLHNLNRELRGQGPLNDLGLYLPPPSLVNKYFSYVVDNTGKQRTSVLLANTPEELKQLESAYRAEVIAANPTIEIVTKSNQEAYNLVHGYMDGEAYMTLANNQLKHSGSSSSAIVTADARYVDEIMQGYQQQILAGMRKYNEMYLNDITQKLDQFSKLNQGLYADQPVRGFFKKKGQDAAMTVKNALLANNNLNQFTTWKSTNEFVDMAIVTTGRAVDSVASTFKKNPGSKEHFDALDVELKKKGIQNPWESFELYQASLIGAPTVNSKRVVAAANGMLGTMMLRFMELGHPLVNAVSVPILASGAVMEGLPSTELPNGARIKLPMRLLMDAMRFSFNPKGIAMQKEWEAAGHIDQVVRQFSDLTGKLHVPVASKGEANKLLDLVEGFQSSKTAEYMSKPSDYVEKQSRAYAMNLGYLAAKHAYPGISDKAATIYAVGMADRVIGNYHAAQRPVLFQGTFGSVLGLFQTYMLTFAQHTYRTIEHGQFKALATTMAAQAGIFGTASWPGYELLSKFIGEHMSNQNYDLTTGTYRAVGDPMAEVILYGLPSTLGPSLYTRGDIAPRIPSQLGDLAIVNSTVGVYNAVAKMLSSVVQQPGFAGKAQGMMEGLSLQTLSRPIARAAEIVAGESVTRKGQTVSTSDDVWTFNGVFSRLLSVRPLEEQVTRNALNLKSYYGAADYDNRQRAVNKLRTAIRAGHMDDDLVDTVAQDYIRHGGTNKGWTSVMNEIMSRTEEGTSYDLLKKLEPDSPLRRMLKDTF